MLDSLSLVTALISRNKFQVWNGEKVLQLAKKFKHHYAKHFSGRDQDYLKAQLIVAHIWKISLPLIKSS